MKTKWLILSLCGLFVAACSTYRAADYTEETAPPQLRENTVYKVFLDPDGQQVEIKHHLPSGRVQRTIGDPRTGDITYKVSYVSPQKIPTKR